jgi:molybdopterin converting factor small subunit
MTVHVPGPLRSYTKNRSEVEAAGTTVDELLKDLDRQFPGMRFRMIDEQDNPRPHIRLYVNADAAGLTTPIGPRDELQILCAISGGS